MIIVLDTNVLSEPLKRYPSDKVEVWLAAQDSRVVYTTAITQAEVLDGVEKLPRGKRRTELETAILRILTSGFSGRILPFDEDAAVFYPKIVAARDAIGRPISELDAMIAAICRSRSAMLATRNVSDFQHCGIAVINPWL